MSLFVRPSISALSEDDAAPSYIPGSYTSFSTKNITDTQAVLLVAISKASDTTKDVTDAAKDVTDNQAPPTAALDAGEIEAIKTLLEYHFNVLKLDVIDQLFQNMACPTCGEAPGRGEDLTTHNMGPEVMENFMALKDWDFCSEVAGMEDPRDWLKQMEARFQLVESRYWYEELSRPCPTVESEEEDEPKGLT